MSAHSIETFVILFPNEEWSSTDTDSQLERVVMQLRPNISFAQYASKHNLQTLSSHSAPITDRIRGFTYVPDLEKNSLCHNISNLYVPANVTRQANLPSADFTLIAVAPWINQECALAYMVSARYDPVRAFLFYLPDNGTAQPPAVDSTTWILKDNEQWKTMNSFPVYAVSSDLGTQLIHELSLYSGNMTSVPYGHAIASLPDIDSRGYVRMYTVINLNNTSVLSSLWVSVLIVIGVLLAMLVLTSGTMHLLQRYRRTSLQRRVASGEVNLEAIGVARLPTPLMHVKQMPILTYDGEEFMDRFLSSPKLPVIAETPNEDTLPNTHSVLTQTQSTCAICLEAFHSGVTQVRQLPCEHLFHPECIDMFLCNSSSLCPICKSSVLPLGYVPTITNSMIRRERNIRRRRSSVSFVDDRSVPSPPNYNDQLGRIARNTNAANFYFVAHPAERMLESDNMLRSQHDAAFMTGALSEKESDVSVLGDEVCDNRQSRQIMAQQRIHEFTASHPFMRDEEVVVAESQSIWRTGFQKAFPGFA